MDSYNKYEKLNEIEFSENEKNDLEFYDDDSLLVHLNFKIENEIISYEEKFKYHEAEFFIASIFNLIDNEVDIKNQEN